MMLFILLLLLLLPTSALSKDWNSLDADEEEEDVEKVTTAGLDSSTGEARGCSSSLALLLLMLILPLLLAILMGFPMLIEFRFITFGVPLLLLGLSTEVCCDS